MLDVNTHKLLQTENDKWQTRPLIKEGAPQRQNSNFQKTTFGQNVISGHKNENELDTLAYWLTDLSCNVTSTSTSTSSKWGSLIFERIKYDNESGGTQTREILRWQGPAPTTTCPLVREGASNQQIHN
jgi:hypothetical protein